MQNGNCDERSNVEPDRNVHVAFAAFDNRADHVPSKNDPDHGNGDIDRPLQFSVFLRSGQPQWQCDDRRNDDRLPTPKVYPAFSEPGTAQLLPSPYG